MQLSQQSETAWTSRKRVEAAINHREPDRVPYDLGGTIVTGIHEKTYRRLRDYLGMPKVEITIEDPIQQLACVHEDIKQKLKIDVYGLSPRGGRNLAREPWSEGGYDKLLDGWGIEWWKPQPDGLYYDMWVHPLAHIDSVQELMAMKFPDLQHLSRFEGMAARADELLNQKQVAYILGRNAPGIFELACWLRGFENFYCDLLNNVPLAEGLLDRICELKMGYWERALDGVGQNVLIVAEADDLASQDRLLMAPAIYRKFIKPRHTRLFTWIKQKAKTTVKIFYHSCGAVAPLIPDLLESGIDILNPVQVSARGMDTRELKRQYGKDLVFHGGGIDTQHVLPHGTPAQIKDEVRRRIDDLAPGGGFIFTTVHNIQADVAPENILALWETLQACGRY